jgi:general secretion pathway protein M
VNDRAETARNLRAVIAARWAALAPRERRGLVIAGLAVAVLLVWWLLVAPPLRTLRETPAQLDRLEVQLQQLQRVAAEARELKAASPVTTAQSATALKAAAERLGDKAKLTVQGDRATLTLNNASAEAITAWLGEARSAARARPLEAQLTRGSAGYSGTVVVQVGGSS